MADGDGGWNRQERQRPELYQGRTLNPTPLATAMPNFPVFNGNAAARPVLWHPSSSTPYPVSIPPVYFTHPPPMPPMDFRNFKLDLPGGAMPLPVFHGAPHLHPHPPPPRSSNHHMPSSGINEGRVSSGNLTPAASNITIPVSPPAKSDQSSVVKSDLEPHSSTPVKKSPVELERHLHTPVNKNSVDKSELERPLSTPVNKNSVESERQLSSPVNMSSVELSSPMNKIPSTDSPAPDFSSFDPHSEPPPVPEDFPRDPVPQGGRGEGWPYAPQGWPHADDKWGWRVGKRASASSLWIDRYVTIPASLVKGKRLAYKTEFASRKSLVEYLRQSFPLMKDPSSIFKAFDWKIPAPKGFEASDKRGSSLKREKPSPTEREEEEHKAKRQCQAGNPHCKATDSEPLLCHICCAEPSFCRACKCVLCCKFFAEDHTIIRCRNSPTSSAQGICGHAAHLECALDAQLAGVVKKSGLDMEYMCRRCDRRTDLKEIVGRLVCEFMSKTATEAEVESSLQLLLRVVQDPEEEARNSGQLHATLIGALKKVQEGADLAQSCEELTAELLELRSGQGSQVSQQMPNWSRRREWEQRRIPDAETVDGVATTTELDMNKDLPGTPPRASLLDQVSTFSIEEHIRQCEAMANRVKGAGQLGSSSLSFSLEVVLDSGSEHPNGTAGDFRSQENHQVVSPEAQASSDNRGAEEQANSRRIFNANDAAEDHVANTEKDEVEEVCMHTNEGAKSAMEDGNKSTEEAGGDDTASTKMTPPTSTFNSKDTILTTQLPEAPTSAGLEAEFEDQISDALEKLKRAQEREYAHAERVLNSQKRVVVDQYRELESVMGKKHLLPNQNRKSRAEFEQAMNQLMAQYGRAQEGHKAFVAMLGISKGFGRVSKECLREFFRWPPSDDAKA